MTSVPPLAPADTLAKARSLVIYLLGLAAVIIGALPQIGVSPGVHATLVAIGGVIVAVERFVQQGSPAAAAKASK